jgi:hypothetical protein
VYDFAANDGFVSVGVDHDTSVFGVKSIEAWWQLVGEPRYRDTRATVATAFPRSERTHRSFVQARPLRDGRAELAFTPIELLRRLATRIR